VEHTGCARSWNELPAIADDHLPQGRHLWTLLMADIRVTNEAAQRFQTGLPVTWQEPIAHHRIVTTQLNPFWSLAAFIWSRRCWAVVALAFISPAQRVGGD
jgi:hypothetical protein